MKKTVKMAAILLITMVLVISLGSVVLAAIAPGTMTPTYDVNMTGLQNAGQSVLGVIRNIAVIGGVIIIAILGIKFMLGSAEERAEYKKSFIPLIVGIIVVMGATTIAVFIFDMAGNF